MIAQDKMGISISIKENYEQPKHVLYASTQEKKNCKQKSCGSLNMVKGKGNLKQMHVIF